jgi:4'-phosphopantetheinyl transferase
MNPHRRDHLAGHIIVWIAQVSQAHDSLAFLEPCLDGRDRERAARFRFPEDRARFILGRGLLRKCLGHYLPQSPKTVELALTNRGRPFFPRDEKLQFSISHTHDLVAVALTADARIGLDLEFVQPDLNLIELAERIFSPDDLRAFQALPAAEKPAAFFRAWTRKEAYLKARGEGIAEKLQEISVSFGPEKTVSVTDGRDKYAANTWRLLSLPVPAGYAGTLACDDPAKRVEGAFVHLREGEIIANASQPF